MFAHPCYSPNKSKSKHLAMFVMLPKRRGLKSRNSCNDYPLLSIAFQMNFF